MRYYMELVIGPYGRKRSEKRVIVETDDRSRCYGLHTSYVDGFTRLDGAHLPPGYLQEWCRLTTEKQARRVMPDLFAFLEQYGITDKSEGNYKKRK